MKKFSFFAILIGIAVIWYYSEPIITFLTYPIFWKVETWMIATWGIYKCSYFIWQGDSRDPHSMEETGREYRSMEEARYKELKHQTKVENIGREINVENWIDENGKPYFIIRVLHELGEFIFIPFKKS